MTLHLVRTGEPPVPVADDDIVVYLDPTGPRHGGQPITYDRLLELVVAARRVITW